MRDNDKKVIHINYMAAEVDPVYFPQVEVVGDIANSIWSIIEKLQPQKHWDFSYFDKVKAAEEKELPHGCNDDRFPIYPQRLVADVRKAMPPEGIIALDNGVYKIWFARNYKALKPNTVLLDNALATMGAGLPSAMAAKLVYPDRPVMAICGDGGFMMNSQELETSVRLKQHIIILILRDDAYGMIKWKQANMNFDEFGLDYGNPDFVKYVESYGGKGHRIASAKELLPLIKDCMQDHAVHLIDVAIDYSENDEILNNQLRKLSAKI
jgi:acetolactate synthase-1/2/3 large subunit